MNVERAPDEVAMNQDTAENCVVKNELAFFLADSYSLSGKLVPSHFPEEMSNPRMMSVDGVIVVTQFVWEINVRLSSSS